MPLAEDVIIQRTETPLFPDRCVVSGGDATTTAPLRASPNGLNGVIKWLLRLNPVISVPVNDKYRWHLTVRPVLRTMSLILIVTVALIVAILSDFPKPPAIIIAVISPLPVIVWHVIRPLPIEFTATGEEMKFEFLSPEYAREFAELNDGVMDDDEEE